MFRIRDPQESLWQSQFLVTPKKAKRLERSWAEVFRPVLTSTSARDLNTSTPAFAIGSAIRILGIMSNSVSTFSGSVFIHLPSKHEGRGEVNR